MPLIGIKDSLGSTFELSKLSKDEDLIDFMLGL
jgi:hypothetical protein